MPLTQSQSTMLASAFKSYSFPAVTFNFSKNCQIQHSNMLGVETHIKSLLISRNPADVKHGLANVLYWGYAQIGYREIRINKFLANITPRQIQDFSNLTSNQPLPAMSQIKKLGLPEFSGVSFISKILMFLDPSSYCTLDQQIAKMRNLDGIQRNVLDNLSFSPNETQIRVSGQNQKVYDAWRHKCLDISLQYYSGSFRSADMERCFFSMIQQGNTIDARDILNNA